MRKNSPGEVHVRFRSEKENIPKQYRNAEVLGCNGIPQMTNLELFILFYWTEIYALLNEKLMKTLSDQQCSK